MLKVCALCQVNTDLQDSHIIPEFLHLPLYEHPHRFHEISADPNIPDCYKQKGQREKLLCRECEQKFSKWEHYAKTAFVDEKGITKTVGADRWNYQGLNYKLFKLFQMSLLWRMGASTLEFFREVELGPYEEKLRITLLQDDPLQPEEYPCVMVALRFWGKMYPDLIFAPSRGRNGRNHVHWIILNGIAHFYYVGNCPTPEGFRHVVLNKSGDLVVPFDDYENYPIIVEAMGSFRDAMAERAKRRTVKTK